MTWNAFHNRGEILRTVIAAADQRLDGTLPTDVAGVREHFTNELDLLAALMLKWHARLSGNVERELMKQPLDLEQAVARAWRATNDELPGVRMIIDAYIEEPSGPDMAQALTNAREREWVRLAAAAGLANDESDAAARAGARVEEAARNLEPVPAEAAAPVGEHAPSFVERIKAVLAA